MKKSIPIIRERESEAFILGNGREREFPLTPAKVAAIYVFLVCKIFGPKIWSCKFFDKGAGSFHIHRKTMKELGTLAVLGVREQPNLAQNLVTHRH